MKILVDEDVYAVTMQFLRTLNHEVLNVSEMDLSGSSDEAILLTAAQQQAILITRDRDFGHLVFVKGLGAGVIYLRMLPSTIEAVHLELKRVLDRYGLEDLKKSFVVVEAGGHRIRRPPRD